MTLANRRDLLQKLLAVEPGLARTDRFLQGKCVILRQGRFYTLSQEIACSIASGLPRDMEAAVRADKLMKMLKELPDETLEISLSKTLNLTACLTGIKRRRVKLPIEGEIKLDVNAVELPGKDDWQPLAEDYGEAILVAASCTKTQGDYLHTCIHVTSRWLEASDNCKMARYKVLLPIAEPCLVRAKVLKEVASLGMTKVAATVNWLHFKNPLGLRVSVQKHQVESYPPLIEFLKLRGTKVTFPKTLVKAAGRAAIVADEDVGIKIEVYGDGSLSIEGKSIFGEYGETKAIKYDGKELSFLVPPKLIAELVEKHNAVEVTDVSLRVNGGKFIFATSLNALKEKECKAQRP